MKKMNLAALRSVACLIAGLGSVSTTFAQLPLSGDVQVNTITASTPYNESDVAASPDGKYSICWNQAFSASLSKAYKRGYTNAGAPYSAAQDVVYSTPPAFDGDLYPRVAMNNSGDYIVTYMENNNYFVTNTNYNSIYFQRYFANGVPNGARVFVDYGMWPDISIAADGSFNISYVSGHYYYCPQAVYVKRYLPTGTALGSRITVESTACTGVGYYNSNIRSRNANAFDVCYSVGNGPGFVIERYNSSGAYTYTNLNMAGNISGQNFVLKSNGDIVTASLISTGGSPATFQSTVCRIPAAGSSVVSTDILSGMTALYTDGARPAIGINDADDYVVVFPKYISNVYQGMYIQQYNSADVEVGPEYPLSTVDNTMKNAAVDVSDCSFTVSWVNGNNVYHKRFALYQKTTPVINPILTALCQGNPVTLTGSYTGTAPGSYNWQIYESDGSGNPVAGGYTWTSPTYTGAPGAYTFPTSSSLACGKYYTIKLTFPTGCGPVSTTYEIFIRCNPTPVISSSANPICSGGNATLCVNYSSSGATSVLWNQGSGTSCIVVSPTVTTVYSVLVTAKGCSATATYTLNVTQNAPNFSLSGNLPSTTSPFYTVSATPSVNPTTVAGLGYYWEVSEVDVLTGTVIAGTTVVNPDCWWLPSNVNNFYGYNYATTYNSSNNTGTAFNGPAGACISTAPGMFEVGHKYRITYGTWSASCPWQAQSATIYMCPGCRTTDGSGWVIEKSEISGSNATNMNELSEGESIQIYPNPNDGSFTLDLINEGQKDVFVYDMMGKIVYTRKSLNERILGIELNSFPKGMYIVKVISGGSIQTKKVITR